MPSCLKNSCLLSCIKGTGTLTARGEERVPLSSRFGVTRQLPDIPEFSASEVGSASFDARLASLETGNIRYSPLYTGVRQMDPSWNGILSSGSISARSMSARSVPLNYLYNSGEVPYGRWSPKSAPVLGGYVPRRFICDRQGGPVFDVNQSPGTGGSQQLWYSQSAGQPGGSSYRVPRATPVYQPGMSVAYSSSRSNQVAREDATPTPKSARNWLEEYIASARTNSESRKGVGHPPKLSLAKVDVRHPFPANGATPNFEDVDATGQYTPPGSFTPTSGISCSPSEQFSMMGGFDPSTVLFGAVLGRGNFSIVRKAEIDGMDFGLKIVRNPAGSGTEALASFMAKNVLHPNLVRICGVQNVTVHCSLDDVVSKPIVDRPGSRLSDKDGQASTGQPPNSGRTITGTELSVSTDMFSDLARTLPQKGGAGREDAETWILMEYCDAGSLDKAIERGQFCENGRFEKPKMLHVLFVALEIASAMTHLHSCGIIHGDVKPENILLQGCDPSPVGMEFTCKVGDFGLSRRTSIHASHVDTFSCGTVTHMAPEVLRDNVLTYAADVYSFGVLLWQLLSGKKPFASQTQSGTIFAIVEGRRPKIPVYFPSWYAHLIEDCWHQNRHARPKFADIVERINLMVLAFERPRMIDPFVSATFSSNHSEMIVAYQGVQPFMEGDLHTNPFYEHADMLYESSSALCLPEGSCPDVSISFDNMQCGSRAGTVRQFSCAEHRQDRYKSNKEVVGMHSNEPCSTQAANANIARASMASASDDGSTSQWQVSTSRRSVDTSDAEIGPDNIAHRFMQFQNSCLPVQDRLAVCTRRCTTKLFPGSDDLHVTVNRSCNPLLSTESMGISSCGTPVSATDEDSDFGGWSPPNRTGAPTHRLMPKPTFSDDDLFSSTSSTSGVSDGIGCIKPLEKLVLSGNGLSRMTVETRTGLELVEGEDDRERGGSTSDRKEAGTSVISSAKIEEITDDPSVGLGQVSNPIVWDSFVTPPASEYPVGRDCGSSCVVYNRYT